MKEKNKHQSAEPVKSMRNNYGSFHKTPVHQRQIDPIIIMQAYENQ